MWKLNVIMGYRKQKASLYCTPKLKNKKQNKNILACCSKQTRTYTIHVLKTETNLEFLISTQLQQVFTTAEWCCGAINSNVSSWNVFLPQFFSSSLSFFFTRAATLAQTYSPHLHILYIISFTVTDSVTTTLSLQVKADSHEQGAGLWWLWRSHYPIPSSH